MASTYASSDKSDSSSYYDEPRHLYANANEKVAKCEKTKGIGGLHSRIIPIFRRGALTAKQSKCAHSAGAGSASAFVPGKKVSFINQNQKSGFSSSMSTDHVSTQGYPPVRTVPSVPVAIERRPLYENIRNNNASPLDVFLYKKNVAALYSATTRAKEKPIASANGRRIEKPKLRTGSSITTSFTADWQRCSGSESGSEAEEIKRIFEQNNNQGNRVDEERRNRANRREDARRHTLTGDHHLGVNYQPNNINKSVDLESYFQSPLTRGRGYAPPSNSVLFDEDPGIMSEVETSSTGFRRGNKLRSSLPVVKTHSKTLERPLGLVFLQYRNETKRSLLPNEITSLDTVKALFVRSFPKQLTMEYLDSRRVKIYIHDSNKDMFYELEDLRSHLNEIRDRSVLRLYECADVAGGSLPAGLSAQSHMWVDQDQSYFSEPEFDSEFQHQHIHKTKGNKSNLAHQPCYMTHSFPPGTSATLPRGVGAGASLTRPFSSMLPNSTKPHAGFMSSPERAPAPNRSYNSYGRNLYEDPYYSQYGIRSSSITPIIDEETSDTELLEDGYSLYSGVKLPPSGTVRPAAAFGLATMTPAVPLDVTRLRVEHMERQLANLTGLVQKALTQTVPTPSPRDRDVSSADESCSRSDTEPPKLSKDRSVSFEKSVSFSGDPPDISSPKQHSSQHAERDQFKPKPLPKPLSLSPAPYDGRTVYRDLQLTPEMYNQLRGLQKKARDLRQEARSLRRMSQAQAHAVKETVRDTYIKIRSMIMSGGECLWSGGADSERIKISRAEEVYRQEIIKLEDDLTELERTVEKLRSNVINRKTRVNMSDVENMALILSKSSKTVADLKLKFPLLQNAMKSLMTLEMERIVTEETFLKEEPDRLESALKRCKKLTGTLVTLKRLASVQEQRLPDNCLSPTTDETPPVTPTLGKCDGSSDVMGSPGCGGDAGGRYDGSDLGDAKSTLDSLLDELQKTSSSLKSAIHTHTNGTLRQLHSFPSSDYKPPVPERNVDSSGKRIPPPPPPRTSSKSPLASPTNPSAPVRLNYSPIRKGSLGSLTKVLKDKLEQPCASTSSSCESINSQEGVQQSQQRQEQLELRHQELLKKQKALQEQYTRLQQLQKTSPPDLLQLKKTGSESDILAKMDLGLTITPISASLSYLVTETNDQNSNNHTSHSLASKPAVYETDIL
ncbi:coiled-coil domain-containing protein AGAP005037-like isoform X2 [Planococcus citri]|uniref:coiled-coil domain-containing protein AGAP005037-like isoform X2 n=1 Tax=Planococcus citri TaxID=170843 RepID=UPI0031F73554